MTRSVAAAVRRRLAGAPWGVRIAFWMQLAAAGLGFVIGAVSLLVSGTLHFAEYVVDRGGASVTISAGDAIAGSTVTLAILFGILALHLWLAFGVLRGGAVARIILTALNGIAAVVVMVDLVFGRLAFPELLLDLVGVAVIVLLWLPESNRYFRERTAQGRRKRKNRFTPPKQQFKL